MKLVIKSVTKISQLRLLINIMIFELLLAAICIIFASVEIKIKSLTYSTELHQNLYNRDFSITLPLQVFFIYLLLIQASLSMQSNETKILTRFIKFYYTPLFGIFCILSFYISNSFY